MIEDDEGDWDKQVCGDNDGPKGCSDMRQGCVVVKGGTVGFWEYNGGENCDATCGWADDGEFVGGTANFYSLAGREGVLGWVDAGWR